MIRHALAKGGFVKVQGNKQRLVTSIAEFLGEMRALELYELEFVICLSLIVVVVQF